MKIENVKAEPVFEPVTIILESQEEVDKLYCITNFTPICDADDFFKQLHDMLYDHQLNYQGYWSELIKKIEKHPAYSRGKR